MNEYQKAIKLLLYLKDNIKTMYNVGDFSVLHLDDCNHRIKYKGTPIGLIEYKTGNYLSIQKRENYIAIDLSSKPLIIDINDKQFSTEISLESNFQDFLTEPLLFDIIKLPKEDVFFYIRYRCMDALIEVLKIT